MAGFDPFGKRGEWPDSLVAVDWVRGATPLAATAEGKALALALGKLEAIHKKLNVAELRPKAGRAFDTLDELDDAERQAKAVYRSGVLPLIAQCAEVRRLATQLTKQAQSDPGIPRPMVMRTAEVVRDTELVSSAFKDLGEIFGPFDVARKRLVKAGDHLRKTLQGPMRQLEKGLGVCLKQPSRDNWDKHCLDACKAIHTVIRSTPALKDALWDTWKVHDGDSFSHALQVAEKSAGDDDKARSKNEQVIVRLCKDLQKALDALDKELA